jgi:hypothetical protein
MARTGLRMMPTFPLPPLKVGSRAGAVFRRFSLAICSPFPLGVPQYLNRKPVSSPRHVRRSVRISRTTPSCLLRVKDYVAYHARATFNNGLQSPLHTPPLPAAVLMLPKKRKICSAFALTYMSLLRSCKLLSVLSSALASRFVGTVTNSRDPSLHDHYNRLPATTIPAVTLSTSVDFPCLRLYGFPAPSISRRVEAGFSSFSACPCHRAVALTPPV